MDSHKSLVSIPCPLHSSEFIQRVALDPDDEQQLYCLECVLQAADNSTPPTGLKNIKDFIDIAATHYAQNKQFTASTTEIPPEYIALLSEQSHHLEELSVHLEEEKKKVENTFNKIIEEIMKMIHRKKTEYLHSLDQQLFNLRYWYIFFDKQVKKAHPKEEDIPFLFPSKEDLVNRIQKISNSTQLMAFVRNIKEDLNAKKTIDVRRGNKGTLDDLYKQLQQLEGERPQFEEESLEISSFRENINKWMSEQLEKMFVMSQSIMDVKHKDFPESKIITASDFKVLKSWLPKELSKFNPKLIYRATRDGMNGNAFHTHCDGKGATYTIIKAQLNSGQVHTVGGFLDQNWQQNQNSAIYSDKAFIFSLTLKNKFGVLSGSEAAYGYANQGPLFGGGYDLGVTDFTNQGNYAATCSYQGSVFNNKAYNPNNDDGEGYSEIYFKLLEMEVYTIN